MQLSRFLARRMGNGNSSEHRMSRPAVRISVAGVAIGLATMIVSVSVAMGFKHTIRDKVAGFAAHIQVGDFMALQTGEPYPIQLNDSMMTVLRSVKGVEHVQRFATVEGLLKTDNDFLGVQFKGMAEEFDTTFIADNLVEGRLPRFSAEKSSQEALLSRWMAGKLNIKTGDRIFAYFINSAGVRPRRFTITGLYETHLSQYDEMVCLTDLHTVQRLHGWQPDQASGAELKVSNFAEVDAAAAELIARVNRTTDGYGEVYTSRTIRELSPQIFYWLDLLDMNIWIVLLIMLLVASVTMISALLIIILERTSMIGTLKALGMRNSTLRHTFIRLSEQLVGRGMIIGNLVALALIGAQQWFGLIRLDPEVYYVSIMPVEINVLHIVLLNILTFVVCLLVLILPSYFIACIHPAESMKVE